MKPLEQYRTDLLRAADYIEEHGWCQRSWRFGQRVCAMGAIGESLKGGWDRKRFLDAHRALEKAVGGSVPGWNDERGQTKENVVAKLREVAMAGL